MSIMKLPTPSQTVLFLHAIWLINQFKLSNNKPVHEMYLNIVNRLAMKET